MYIRVGACVHSMNFSELATLKCILTNLHACKIKVRSCVYVCINNKSGRKGLFMTVTCILTHSHAQEYDAYMYMYVYIYIYIYACMYAYQFNAYTHTHAFTYIYTCKCICIYTYIHM